MKILIVEDDPVLGELLCEYLQQLKHERVKFCLTAHQALSAIKKETFDSAFVDLRLPDMDGLKLLETLKTLDPSIPVVIMTGYPTMSHTIEAMRKGASDFLVKPFAVHDMALALERIMKERKLLLENLSLKLECQAREQLELVNKNLQEKVLEQKQLFEISREIDEMRSSDDLYPRLVQLAGRLTGSERIGFFILPPDQEKIILIAASGLQDDTSAQRLMDIPDPQLKKKLNSGNSHVCIRAEQLLSQPDGGNPNAGEMIYSCWPLRIRGELFGFLAVSCDGKGLSPTEMQVHLLGFLMTKASLAIENMALYESLIGNFYAVLKSLVSAIEAKDLYTGKHSERVTKHAVEIARKMHCTPEQIESLQTVGFLHDIGKIGIADSILNKSSPLTSEEYEIVKNHPVVGDTIVAGLGLSTEERSIIRHHHERWDGTGYPDGLAGEEISLLARIVMVADAFDAMISSRAYREKMSHEDALRELRENRGRQFDPDVVDAFLSIQRNLGHTA